jgi:hypothetical protein
MRYHLYVNHTRWTPPAGNIRVVSKTTGQLIRTIDRYAGSSDYDRLLKMAADVQSGQSCHIAIYDTSTECYVYQNSNL